MTDKELERIEAGADFFTTPAEVKALCQALRTARQTADKAEAALTAIEQSLPGWASDTSDVPVVDLVRACVATFVHQVAHDAEAREADIRRHMLRLARYLHWSTTARDKVVNRIILEERRVKEAKT